MAEITFLGEKFQILDQANEFALMEFASAAQEVDEENSLEALATIYRLIQATIVPEDWKRFRAHAREKRATVDQLMEIAVDVFEAASENPTQQPVVSSDGHWNDASKSEDDSSSRVIEKLQNEGRPAWALIALQQKEARSA